MERTLHFEQIADRISTSAQTAAVAHKGNRRLVARTASPWTLPGFDGTARVMTSFGNLPIQALRLRDPLRLTNGAFAQVAWLDHIRLDEDFLRQHPDAQPILIRAGSFGSDRPAADMLVSPHQRVCISASPFGQEFRMARDLLGRPGVLRRPLPMVSYYMFHCTTPVTAMIEGIGASIAP